MIQLSKRRLPFILAGAAILMFGFAFALVPLYNTLCSQLGINGKPELKPGTYSAQTSDKMDKSREVVVEFLTTKNESLPWKFYPEIKKVTVHPGEDKKLAFFIQNDSDHTMVVQAIPSITPGIAAKYFKKIECFCFTHQTLKAHEAMHMPLLFHLDPQLPENIHTLTLAYTLFDVTDRVNTGETNVSTR